MTVIAQVAALPAAGTAPAARAGPAQGSGPGFSAIMAEVLKATPTPQAGIAEDESDASDETAGGQDDTQDDSPPADIASGILDRALPKDGPPDGETVDAGRGESPERNDRRDPAQQTTSPATQTTAATMKTDEAGADTAKDDPAPARHPGVLDGLPVDNQPPIAPRAPSARMAEPPQAAKDPQPGGMQDGFSPRAPAMAPPMQGALGGTATFPDPVEAARATPPITVAAIGAEPVARTIWPLQSSTPGSALHRPGPPTPPDNPARPTLPKGIPAVLDPWPSLRLDRPEPVGTTGSGGPVPAEIPLRLMPGGTAAPAAPLSPAPIAPENLGTVIAQRANSGGGMTEISLAPEDLGRLRMQLTPEGERIRIVLSAELPETLDLLRRSVTEFTEDLRRMGFASASFDFAGWGGQPADPPPRTEHIAGGLTAADEPLVLHIASPRRAGLDLRL